MSIVFLNGVFLAQEDALVSVMDRGFTFGDGIYEIIPFFSGEPLRFSQHISRLNDSLSAIQINSPYTEAEWKDIITEVINRNPVTTNLSLYIQITRGVGEREHIYDNDLKPTVFVMCKPIIDRDFSTGVSVITHEDIRWQYCHIKAISLLAGILLKKLASEKDGSFEAILIRGGIVTEGVASNVFVIKDKVVKTPAKDGSVLPGITRDLLLELMYKSGLECMETTVSEKALKVADEIWITSSTMGVVPVVKLDGEIVGNGKPGKVWQQANSMYETFL